MSTDSFRDFGLERLVALGGPHCRRMFGDHGLYRGERLFAIAHDGTLYFRTNSGTLTDFLSRHCAALAPHGNQIWMKYREVHGDIPENAECLTHWAEMAAPG